jgi:hypothetical protein
VAIASIESLDQLRAGLEAEARGDGLDLTPQEAEHYFDTGELPERVQHAGEAWAEQWHASRG